MKKEMPNILGFPSSDNTFAEYARQQAEREANLKLALQGDAGVVKRQPVTYQYQALNWNFIKLLAEIANYAAEKYGSAEQYTNGRLEGQRSPLNHIAEHMRAYMAQEKHDKFGDLEHQLAAIAYNAMMEFHYLQHGGPTTPDVFYKGEV